MPASGYSVNYDQRRKDVTLLSGKDVKGKTWFVRDPEVILNVNNDRCTTVTLLSDGPGQRKALARFNREDVLIKADGTLVENLLRGSRLSHLEDQGHY